jgi:hypothetical protein
VNNKDNNNNNNNNNNSKETITLDHETNRILKRKNGEYIPHLKYSVPIFVK